MAGTIVDSNVLIDVLEPSSAWGEWSTAMITQARLAGRLVYNVVIAAEVAHEFVSEDRFHNVFPDRLWDFEDIPVVAAIVAGWAHREYRSRGGLRERTLPDFLIGAHASVCGHRLITRDPRPYRTYFPAVEIIAPDTHP
jgi:predicted nucleic acid-binding protein